MTTLNTSPTHSAKFSARVQGFKVAEDCVTAISAAQTCVEQLRAKIEGSAATIETIRQSNLPDDLKNKMISEYSEVTGEYDAARIHAHETLAGIVNGIRAKLLAPDSANVAKMDVQQLAEIVASANDLYRTFSKLFPSKVVSQ